MTWTLWCYGYLIVGALVLFGALCTTDRDPARELATRGTMPYPKARRYLWLAALVFVLIWPLALAYAVLRPRRKA
jgi:hypothetical protein